jgi:acylphosphatase
MASVAHVGMTPVVICRKDRSRSLLTLSTVKNEVVARRYYVSGRVQGVGYRIYVERVAATIGLQGYVRNRRTGSVEVFAMGTPEQLEQLRGALEKGPMMSRVDELLEETSSVDKQYLGQFVIEITE